jgi:hypothetical protein
MTTVKSAPSVTQDDGTTVCCITYDEDVTEPVTRYLPKQQLGTFTKSGEHYNFYIDAVANIFYKNNVRYCHINYSILTNEITNK